MLPLVAFAASNKSSVRFLSLLDFLSNTSKYLGALSEFKPSLFNKSTYDIMDVSGVLISWDTFVISSVFSLSLRTSFSTAVLSPEVKSLISSESCLNSPFPSNLILKS